ncbi:lambda family phage tail tape measure protein [Paraburkholderia sp. BL6665CI2N2]|uniref:phage tail tape measure protein n=1 Tax=Paraburkholderia sp. BL6665CI2N2 TaxID=1938806 RepID=UPI0010664B45|nr:phage tail tape measure protein [Paraburkholderia sp. BL6665CI2N2]TDY23942.1 lambda family phage tail tape measure protein [Paraburkholderia sp. BL6665CI2N2]
MSNETVVRLTGDSSGFTASMDRARKSAESFTASIETQRQRVTNSVTATENSRKALQDQGQAAVDAFNKSAASAERWLTTLQKQADQAGKTQAEMMRLRAAELGVAGDAEQYIAKIEAASAATAGAGHSASGARREMIVLAHEMSQGNWSRFGGSMMVMGERLDAIKYLTNPVALGFVAIAAAGTLMYKAIEEANSRTEAFHNAMNTTMGYAAQTRESIQALAETLSGRFGVGVGTATDDMNLMVASGKISADVFPQVATVAEAMAKTTGDSFDKVLEGVVKQQEDVQKAAEAYQAAHHTMTDAQMSLIDSLNKTGQKHEAFTILINQEMADIANNTKIHASAMVGFWDNVTAAWQRYTRSLSGNSTDLDKLNDLKAKQAAQQSGKTANYDYTDYAPLIAAQQKIVDANNADQTAADKNNRMKVLLAESQKEVAAQIERTLSPQQKLTEALKRDNDIIDNRIKLLKDSGAYTPGAGAQLEAQRRQMIAFDTQAITPARKARTTDNGINASIADLTAQQKMIEDATRASIEHIKALRMDGVINEQDALAQSYVAEQSALQKRIDIDKQQEELAKGKKNTEAYRKYADDIARLQQQMTANYQKFTDDIQAASERENRAVKAYTDGLTEQLSTQQAAASMKLAGMSMGGVANADYATQIKLMEDFDKKKAALDKSLTEKRIDPSQYARELAATQTYYSDSVDIARKSSADILAANQDWTTGASRAIQNYADSANNVASQVDSMFTGMAKSMEDSLATFATTGKLNFRSLVDSMIQDMVRMQARAELSGLFNMAASWISGGSFANSFGTGVSTSIASGAASGVSGSGYSSTLMGLTSLLPARATGGPVDAGTTYLVGEKGPELFNPGTSGTIIPNHAISSSSGGGDLNVTVPVTIEGSGSATDQKNAGDLGMKIKQAVQAVLQSERKQGGVLWKAQNGIA